MIAEIHIEKWNEKWTIVAKEWTIFSLAACQKKVKQR